MAASKVDFKKLIKRWQPVIKYCKTVPEHRHGLFAALCEVGHEYCMNAKQDPADFTMWLLPKFRTLCSESGVPCASTDEIRGLYGITPKYTLRKRKGKKLVKIGTYSSLSDAADALLTSIEDGRSARNRT